jgi:hypothetical protein
MPANLEIVALSTAGPGTVVTDNSDDIGMKLWMTARTTGNEIQMPHPPRNGAMIGGIRAVTPHGPDDGAPSPPEPSPRNTCGVSRVGAHTGSSFTLWFSLAGMFLALRRRHR